MANINLTNYIIFRVDAPPKRRAEIVRGLNALIPELTDVWVGLTKKQGERYLPESYHLSPSELDEVITKEIGKIGG